MRLSFLFYIVLGMFLSCTFLADRGLPVTGTPRFELSGGTYNRVIQVTISCSTEKAKIMYTTDGSLPSKDHGIIYSAPVEVSKSTTIKAIAFRDQWDVSNIAEERYTIIGNIIVKHGTTMIADVTGDFNITTYNINESIETPFTIENTGNSSITIEDITLDTTSDYYILGIPSFLTIPPGFSISISVKFTPLQTGITKALIRIKSKDIADHYSFKITGNVLKLETLENTEIELTYDGKDIQSNNYTYDFGKVIIGVESTSDLFTIRNTGTSDLTLRGNPMIQFLGTNGTNFNIVQPKLGIISSGGFETFRIIFAPLLNSPITSDLLILNNDKDEYVFSIKVTGEGVDKTPPVITESTINITYLKSTSLQLNWTKSSDNISLQSDLKYLAYYSIANTMNSVDEIETNGTAIGSFTKDINSIAVTGLIKETNYYFNIIVMDDAGNKACYSPKNQITPDIGSITVKNSDTIINNITGNFAITSYYLNTTIEKNFTITNTGLSYVTIDAINLDTTSDCYTLESPAALTIAPGLSASFTVNYTPRTLGITKSLIKIKSEDIAGKEYIFNITGTACELPTDLNTEIEISYGTTDILSGQYTYDFGSINFENEVTSANFTITNSGTSTLKLNGDPLVEIITGDTSRFSIIQPAVTSITPGSSTTFKIAFAPKTISSTAFEASIKILNNDADESIFIFNIKGDGKDLEGPLLSQSSLTISDITYYGVKLQWSKGSDNTSDPGNLGYRAYYSTNPAMTNITDIKTNGTPFNETSDDIDIINISGLLPSTHYYFNVIVTDEAGNCSCFTVKDSITSSKTINKVCEINTTGDSFPSALTIFNDKLYFNAIDSFGNCLWNYDGATCTKIAGTENANPSNLTVFNSKLYFNGENTSTGKELWSYDGTNPPSVIDIYTGTASSNPSYLKVLLANLYFSADNGTNGVELYSYNGVDTPQMVYDIYSGPSSGNPEYITPFGNKIVFSALNSAYGNELWYYTATGDPLCIDFSPNTLNSNPENFTEFNGRLYYSAVKNGSDVELYEYNGATDKAGIIKFSINPLGDSNLSNFKVFNSKLYFSATDGINGIELWCYDGINAPYMVSNINASGDSNPQFLTVYRVNSDKEALFFSATDGDKGSELWCYDGINPPFRVTDINSSGDSNPQFLTVYNETLYFSATDGINGMELWKLKL